MSIINYLSVQIMFQCIDMPVYLKTEQNYSTLGLATRNQVHIYECGIPGENYRQITDKRYHIMLYISSTTRHAQGQNSQGADCTCSHKSNYHTIMTTSTSEIIGVYLYIECTMMQLLYEIRVITKLPNSEQSYKGKVKTHKFINR